MPILLKRSFTCVRLPTDPVQDKDNYTGLSRDQFTYMYEKSQNPHLNTAPRSQ